MPELNAELILRVPSLALSSKLVWVAIAVLNAGGTPVVGYYMALIGYATETLA
jgi:hypothetical protein